MKRTNVFYLFASLLFVACGQNSSTQQKTGADSLHTNKKDTAELKLSIDTNKIAILSSLKINFFSLKDSTPAKLVNSDIELIETLLTDCVKKYNIGFDSTRLYSPYIDLKKYKRQYIPYTNSKGEKTVFINCFCRGVAGFDHWKEKLVEIEDGGKCFFNVTINLAKKLCEAVLINGPG